MVILEAAPKSKKQPENEGGKPIREQKSFESSDDLQTDFFQRIRQGLQEASNALKKWVPEAGIPSIDSGAGTSARGGSPAGF